MDVLNNAGMLLGGAWASGVNLYLTVAGLGIADRLGIADLPGELSVLSNLMVILVALFLFAIEFFADKIPYVDSAWDSVHTFIRPFGGAMIAYMAASDASAPVQLSAALVCGGVALDSHLTKATTRVAINTSPEPITNSAASFAEDGLVLVAMWLIIKHPVVAGVLVVSFIVFSVWFLRVMFDFLKKVIGFLRAKKADAPPADKERGGGDGPKF